MAQWVKVFAMQTWQPDFKHIYMITNDTTLRETRVKYHRLHSGWEVRDCSLKGMLANDQTSFHQVPSPRSPSSQQHHFLGTDWAFRIHGPLRDISSKL